MASTISNINTALVDARVVKALRYVLLRLSAFSYLVGPKNAIQNNVVRVPIATDPTVGDKTAGTMGTASGTATGTDVTLSSFRTAPFDAVEGTMSADLFPSYWADKVAGAVYGLGKDVVDTALALVTATNYSNVEGTDKFTKAQADFTQSALAEFCSIGVTKVKQRERTIVLNTGYAMTLLGNSVMAIANAAAGNNVLASGELPNLLGTPAFQYDALPTNSENLKGIFLGRAAICVAVAIPDQLMVAGDGDIVERRIISDPESGLGVLYTMTASGGGTVNGECCLLFGVAKGQNALVRLVSG